MLDTPSGASSVLVQSDEESEGGQSPYVLLHSPSKVLQSTTAAAATAAAAAGPVRRPSPLGRRGAPGDSAAAELPNDPLRLALSHPRLGSGAGPEDEDAHSDPDRSMSTSFDQDAARADTILHSDTEWPVPNYGPGQGPDLDVVFNTYMPTASASATGLPLSAPDTHLSASAMMAASTASAVLPEAPSRPVPVRWARSGGGAGPMSASSSGGAAPSGASASTVLAHSAASGLTAAASAAAGMGATSAAADAVAEGVTSAPAGGLSAAAPVNAFGGATTPASPFKATALTPESPPAAGGLGPPEAAGPAAEAPALAASGAPEVPVAVLPLPASPVAPGADCLDGVGAADASGRAAEKGQRRVEKTEGGGAAGGGDAKVGQVVADDAATAAAAAAAEEEEEEEEDDADDGSVLGLLAGMDEGALRSIPPALLALLQQLEEERDELAGRLLESDAELSALRASYNQLSQSHASSQTWLNQLLSQQLEIHEQRRQRRHRQALRRQHGQQDPAAGPEPAPEAPGQQALGLGLPAAQQEPHEEEEDQAPQSQEWECGVFRSEDVTGELAPLSEDEVPELLEVGEGAAAVAAAQAEATVPAAVTAAAEPAAEVAAEAAAEVAAAMAAAVAEVEAEAAVAAAVAAAAEVEAEAAMVAAVAEVETEAAVAAAVAAAAGAEAAAAMAEVGAEAAAAVVEAEAVVAAAVAEAVPSVAPPRQRVTAAVAPAAPAEPWWASRLGRAPFLLAVLVLLLALLAARLGNNAAATAGSARGGASSSSAGPAPPSTAASANRDPLKPQIPPPTVPPSAQQQRQQQRGSRGQSRQAEQPQQSGHHHEQSLGPGCTAVQRLGEALCCPLSQGADTPPSAAGADRRSRSASTAASALAEGLCHEAGRDAGGLGGSVVRPEQQQQQPCGLAVRGAMEELQDRWQRLTAAAAERSSGRADGARAGAGRQRRRLVDGSKQEAQEEAAAQAVSAWATSLWLPAVQPLVGGLTAEDELPDAILAVHRVAALTSRLCSEIGYDIGNLSEPVRQRLDAAVSDAAAVMAAHVDVSYAGGAVDVAARLGATERCLGAVADRVEAGVAEAEAREECRRRCGPRARLASVLKSLGLPSQLVAHLLQEHGEDGSDGNSRQASGSPSKYQGDLPDPGAQAAAGSAQTSTSASAATGGLGHRFDQMFDLGHRFDQMFDLGHRFDQMFNLGHRFDQMFNLGHRFDQMFNLGHRFDQMFDQIHDLDLDAHLDLSDLAEAVDPGAWIQRSARHLYEWVREAASFPSTFLDSMGHDWLGTDEGAGGPAAAAASADGKGGADAAAFRAAGKKAAAVAAAARSAAAAASTAASTAASQLRQQQGKLLASKAAADVVRLWCRAQRSGPRGMQLLREALLAAVGGWRWQQLPGCEACEAAAAATRGSVGGSVHGSASELDRALLSLHVNASLVVGPGCGRSYGALLRLAREEGLAAAVEGEQEQEEVGRRRRRRADGDCCRGRDGKGACGKKPASSSSSSSSSKEGAGGDIAAVELGPEALRALAVSVRRLRAEFQELELAASRLRARCQGPAEALGAFRRQVPA